MKKKIGAILLVTIIALALGLPVLPASAGDDTTPPTTTLGFGHPGYDGWYPCGVMVTLNATDNEGSSGVAKTQYYIGNAIDPVPSWSDAIWDYMISIGLAHIYTEPFPVCWLGYTNETLFYRSVDNAGNNEEVRAELLKIDMSLPQISYTQTPAVPNSNGWYTEPVNIAFTCSDPHSGIQTCPEPITVTDGWNQMFTVTAYDNVGFHNMMTVGPYHVDTTAPTITVNSPGDDAIYPVGTVVTLSFSFADNIFWPTASAFLNGQWVWSGCTVTDPGFYELVLKAKDAAGNKSSKTVHFVIYDPEAGFVTGGGSIIPGAGSNPAEPAASFEFVARYKKEAFAGSLEYQYSDINLESTSIDWLVIIGAGACFQGTGTINGAGLYTFRVMVKDGGEPGVGMDKFDIMIWEGTSTEAGPVHKAKNVLSEGNIQIHNK